MRFVALCALSALVFACGPSSGDGDGTGMGGPDAGPGDGFPDAWEGGNPDEFADAAPAQACSQMDILFIVDDSGSMGEEQANLVANFPEFMNVIQNYQTQSGDLLDYHVAVTTTGRDISYTMDPLPGVFPPIQMSEEGDNGVFRQDCGMTRRWLERTDTDVAGTFACAAEVGTSGPGIEMPLHSVDLAFGARMADNTNTGFLRDDALLAIVILTDEDDCSRQDNNFTVENDACASGDPNIVDVDYYLDYLDNLKGERGRWATAVIAGPGPGTCSSSFGEAYEATRLKEFVSKTGTNAVFSSICEGSLTGALQDALDTFDAACASFPDVD
jgi:hypothetical protein